LLLATVVVALSAAAAASGASFTNQILRAPFNGATTSPPNQSGDSEPAIAFGQDGTMAVDGLGWLPFAVNLWKGHFGDTPPPFFGPMDTIKDRQRLETLLATGHPPWQVKSERALLGSSSERTIA
jgi:hypothetical protein